MRIKNWKIHQHFKDRNPPWIKLHRDILDDPDWHELDGKSAKVLVMLWLVGSEDKNKEGELPSLRKLSFRLHMKESELKQSIQNLNHWLIHDDIRTISERYQVGPPETETETETETEAEYIPIGILSGKKKPARPLPVFPVSEIVEYLNEKAGKDFSDKPKPTKQHIIARCKEGFSLSDFQTVIDFKVDEWGTDAEMMQYIRPQTLFGTKFEGYLQAAKAAGYSAGSSTGTIKVPTMEEIAAAKEANECSNIRH